MKKYLASISKSGRALETHSSVVLSEPTSHIWSGSVWLYGDVKDEFYHIKLEDGRFGRFKVVKVTAGEPNLVDFLGVGPLLRAA